MQPHPALIYSSMRFKPNCLYHIYNQGNNRQKIFFHEGNYHFFLGKMQDMLTPYGRFLAYCLMPNHFHWLFFTNENAVSRVGEILIHAHGSNNRGEMQVFSRAIGTLLSSYTRAINNQEERTGSLFRAGTKAKNGWMEIGLAGGPFRKRVFSAGNDYALRCLHYIHQNPVKAGLVDHPERWVFSSAWQYGIGDADGLCDLQLAQEVFQNNGLKI